MHVCINRLFFGYLCKNRPTTTTRLCHQYRVICAWCTCKVKRKKLFCAMVLGREVNPSCSILAHVCWSNCSACLVCVIE